MFEVILFTNRSLLVFDEEGRQHPLQEAVDCYGIHQGLLEELLKVPARYYVARWGKWKEKITKREFEYLLGQRSRERDLEEQDKGGKDG